MTYKYIDAKRESDPHALPDVEVFELVRPEEFELEEFPDGKTWLEPGWYYRYGMPGYLPDSDPFGPFDTEEEALEDAREYSGVYDNDEVDKDTA